MEKNKKYIFPIILAVTLIVCGVVWLGKAENDNIEPIRGSSTSVSWTEGFASVDEMEAAADIGIVGVLSDSETELRGSIVFTRNTVEVVAVHSGDIQVGDLVVVLQTGGTFGDISTPAISEVPLMEAGKKYGLFLKQTIPDEIYGQYYLISGGYQGFAEISNVAAPSTISETVEFTDYFADNFN